MQLSPEQLGYLRDHRVGDDVVLPAATLVDMVLEAATVVFGSTPVRLEDVFFQRMLTVPEAGAQAVQLAITAGGPDTATFQVVTPSPTHRSSLRLPWICSGTVTSS